MLCLHETLQILHLNIIKEKLKELKENNLKQYKQKSYMHEVYLNQSSDSIKNNYDETESIPEIVMLDNIGPSVENLNKSCNILEKDETQAISTNMKSCSEATSDENSTVIESRHQKRVEVDQSEIHFICNNVKNLVHYVNPFQMSTAVNCDIARLALSCLQFGVHQIITRFLQPDQLLLKAAIVDAEILIKQSVTDKFDNMELQKCELFDENMYSSFRCEDDFQLGQILKSYFYIYKDHIPEVIRIIDMSEDPKQQRWQCFLDCLMEFSKRDLAYKHISEGNVAVAFDIMRSGAAHEGMCLLAHIYRLFFLYPEKTLQFCCELNKDVPVDFVLFLCMKSEHPLQHFLTYCNQLLLAAPSHLRNVDLEELCQKEAVRMALTEALLKEGIEEDNEPVLHCRCGQPKPRSHKYKWKENHRIDSILSLNESHNDSMLSLCKSYGYWQGSLKLQRILNQKQYWTRLVVQLCDIDLFEREMDECQLCGSIQDWEKLFQLKQQQHIQNNLTISCLFCKEQHKCEDVTLNWENLATCLVKQIGPAKALLLLQRLKLPEEVLSFTFYQKCILAAVLESSQRTVVHNILDKFGTYLWSVKPKTVPAQVLGAVEWERKYKEDTPKDSIFSRLALNGSIKQGVEERDVHWGTCLDLESFCSACFLSLNKYTSQSYQTVVVFRCGHAFHKHCYGRTTCIICKL